MFLLAFVISYYLKLTIYLSEQLLFLLSIFLAKKDVGIKIEMEDGELPEDQFTRKFTDEDIIKMAIKVKKKFGDSITRKMIEDFCSISSRQADRIREILPRIPNLGARTVQ